MENYPEPVSKHCTKMIIDQISYTDKQDEINNWLNIIFEIDKKIKEYNEVISYKWTKIIRKNKTFESNKNNDNYIDDKPMQKIDPNKYTENIKPIVKLKKNFRKFKNKNDISEIKSDYNSREESNYSNDKEKAQLKLK